MIFCLPGPKKCLLIARDRSRAYKRYQFCELFRIHLSNRHLLKIKKISFLEQNFRSTEPEGTTSRSFWPLLMVSKAYLKVSFKNNFLTSGPKKVPSYRSGPHACLLEMAILWTFWHLIGQIGIRWIKKYIRDA